MYQRDTFGAFAAVNAESIRKNQIICALVSKNRKGDFDDSSYFDKVVSAMTFYDSDLQEKDHVRFVICIYRHLVINLHI